MSKAHFIGLCGLGMSATARLLADNGWEITGSDEGFYPPASDYVTTQGWLCHPHHDPKNIPLDADLIVIGKHAKLTPEDNAEVAAAFASGKKIKSFPEVLQELTKETTNLVVAGSFGKSTCTSLAAWVLSSAEKKPSYFIGAIPLDLPINARKDTGKIFVLEGDEYPTANWDPRSKFLYLNANHILLTSLEHDHLNIFPTHESYIKPYLELINLLPETGKIIACLDDQTIRDERQNFGKDTITYSVDNPEADWSAQNINYGETTTFDLVHKNQLITRMETRLLGRHNIQNIVGVSALLLSVDAVSPEELTRGLQTAKGLVRRLDKKSEKTTVLIYEGFGSSYAKLRSAFDALKTHFPNKRLITIFEPHTFSWRNRGALAWYESSFSGSDLTLIYQPPNHGATTHDQLSLEEIVAAAGGEQNKVIGFEKPEDCLEILNKELKSDDLILISTSGDLGGLIKSIPNLAESLFPKT